ncbi:hypothetical protein SLS56_007308 [Neofusicoccum ribis]|uniref:Uncharacterized protein n=1 Tax=Neofusicoccum ribis TaxID=45134 RepID=A0ABR3SNZ4_9PEZI
MLIWIQKWEEFDRMDRGILFDMYPELLNHERRRPDIPEIDPLLRDVWKHDSVQNIHDRWNATVVCEALKETKDFFGQEDQIWMILGSSAQPLKTAPKAYPLRPDWAAIFKTKGWKPGQDAAKSMMPGDTKVSTGWKSEEIVPGSTMKATTRREEWFKPLAQIFTYCRTLRVRYGYLITDQELVAVRIGYRTKVPKKKGKRTVDAEMDHMDKDGWLEYARVTWTQEESSSSLTVNLALWWLHLLAANDNSIRWKYPPLKEETLYGQGRSTVHEHEQSQNSDVTDAPLHSFNGSIANSRYDFRKRHRADEQQGNKKKVRIGDPVDESD